MGTTRKMSQRYFCPAEDSLSQNLNLTTTKTNPQFLQGQGQGQGQSQFFGQLQVLSQWCTPLGKNIVGSFLWPPLQYLTNKWFIMSEHRCSRLYHKFTYHMNKNVQRDLDHPQNRYATRVLYGSILGMFQFQAETLSEAYLSSFSFTIAITCIHPFHSSV